MGDYLGGSEHHIMSFTASKSAMSSETLVDYLNTFDPQERDIESVPGVGPSAREAFQEDDVHTVQALLGRLLSFCTLDKSCHDVYQDFYNYVHEIAPRANGHTITFAIASLADHMGLLPWED